VLDLQGYAGTASPITFNGLVRQYYLRADAEQGDLQVNLVDKQHRTSRATPSRSACGPRWSKIAARHGARLKVVEVPPGPPVMSPLVAEVYGPDEAGRQQLAARVAQAFGATPDIVGIDTTLREDAPRAFLRVQRQRAEALGIPVAAIAQTVQGALSGTDAAYLHDGHSKYPVPVRLQLPREAQVGLDALLALPLRAANGQLVPLSELVRVERGVIDKPLYTKDLQGVSYVFGDVGRRQGDIPDSPLYGLFAIRAQLAAAALPGTGELGEYWISSPATPTAPVRRQVGRRVADHLRDLPRHGRRLRRRPDPDLPAGGGAVQELPDAADHHGADPADHHRRDAGPCAAGANFTATSMIGMIALAGIIVRNSILLVDFIELQVAQGVAFKDAVVQSPRCARSRSR
jgi:multidrug efflux pump subunit AcrB